jgi:hypothetical protein
VEVPSAADGASGGNIAFLSGGKRYAIIVAGATAAFREVRTGGAKYPVGDGNSAKKISIA